MLANRTHEPAVVLRIGERQVNFWFAARLNHCGKANRAGHDYRSPLSPWPGFALVFALLRRSAASDRPTSSDSLNCPLVLRRTNRLSVPVLMSSLFAIIISLRRQIRLEDCCCQNRLLSLMLNSAPGHAASSFQNRNMRGSVPLLTQMIHDKQLLERPHIAVSESVSKRHLRSMIE